MNEIWKDVPGLTGRYQASTLGRIKSLSRKVNTWNGYKTIPECILKPGIGPGGYAHVRIDGKCVSVHRLVAKTFLPPPGDNETQVNHIDENKTNNRVDNLMWCTPKQNIRWGTALERRAKSQRESGCQINNKGTSRPVLCVTTGVEYPSIMEGSRQTGADTSTIIRVCKGKLHTTKGLKWRYL